LFLLLWMQCPSEETNRQTAVRPTGRSVGRSVDDRCFCYFHQRSVDRSIGRSVGRSVSRWMTDQCFFPRLSLRKTCTGHSHIYNSCQRPANRWSVEPGKASRHFTHEALLKLEPTGRSIGERPITWLLPKTGERLIGRPVDRSIGWLFFEFDTAKITRVPYSSSRLIIFFWLTVVQIKLQLCIDFYYYPILWNKTVFEEL
jgi:hypothetical protein